MRWITVTVAIVLSITTYAQTLKTDDGVMRWECSFLAGLNTDGYQIDFGIAYFPIQFVGVKAALGMSRRA